MVSPVSHAIALGLLVWLSWQLRAASRPDSGAARRDGALRAPNTGGVWLLPALLFAWLVGSTWLAYRGLYLSRNDSWLLIVWGTAVPIVLIAASAVWPPSRRSLVRLAEGVSLVSLIGIQAVRVLSVGTIYKWWIGLLPGHFILPVGVPDFLIGATAPWMAHLALRDAARFRGVLVAWNAIGALVLLSAPALIQLSQPGPLQVYLEGPTTDEVLGFPMSIVPTFVAPLFVALHALALLRLFGWGGRGVESRCPDS